MVYTDRNQISFAIAVYWRMYIYNMYVIFIHWSVKNHFFETFINFTCRWTLVNKKVYEEFALDKRCEKIEIIETYSARCSEMSRTDHS